MSVPSVTHKNENVHWQSQQRHALLAVSVSPVLFDKNTSVFRTLCKFLRTEASSRTVLGLDVPLYEDWQDKDLHSITDVSKQLVDCVLL